LDAETLAEIAGEVAGRAEQWIERLASHPNQRTGMRLTATVEFDVWLLRWPFGTNVDPHDHGDSVGAFAVVSGELAEVRWPDGAAVLRSVLPGDTVKIDRGVVHDVIGLAPDSISVHAYSPPLTTMAFYDEAGQQAIDRQYVDEGDIAVGSSQLLHPSRGR
jgi:uncharacterized RmlC-like cupin family protein